MAPASSPKRENCVHAGRDTSEAKSAPQALITLVAYALNRFKIPPSHLKDLQNMLVSDARSYIL